MPRRPRPSSRRPPKNESAAKNSVQTPLQKATLSTQNRHSQKSRAILPSKSDHNVATEDSEELEDSEVGSSASEEENHDDFFEGGDEEKEEDVDVDAPRVAQWIDEEELDAASEEDASQSESSEDDDEFGEGSSNGVDMHSLQSDLSSLPLGALRKAQSALSRAKAISDSEDEGASDENNSEPEEVLAQPNAKAKGKEKEKQEINKRKNKHAPMEVTSKKPVPRKKVEIEKRLAPRDPRFLPLAGEFSAQRFQSQYGFLAGMHQDEMKTLKDNLKRACKLLASSPRDLREERELEVQRLERAMKRAESTVNKDRRDKIEQTALSKAAEKEREGRKQGKKSWYMKDSDKKELLVRAKYDALAASGGRGAVKKAIEKKQKKINQKEKKKRPFGPETAGKDNGWAGKRAHDGSREEGARLNKRQRLG